MSDNSSFGRNLPLLAALLAGIFIGGGGIYIFKDRIVRAALLENPEILIEAGAELQKRDAAERLATAGDGISTAFAGAVAGNPQGDVTVVKFTDYNCGYCRASLPQVEKLIEEDKGVRIVYREIPILSETSEIAARWALAAAQQGKYVDFHRAMFAAGRPDQGSVREIARQIGLNMEKAEAAVASEEISRELRQNLEMQKQLGNIGTPTFVIGGKLIEGLQEYSALQDAVNEARES